MHQGLDCALLAASAVAVKPDPGVTYSVVLLQV